MLSRFLNARSGVVRAARFVPLTTSPVTVISRGFSSPASREPLPPTLIEKYRLDDPTRWVPLTVGSFGLASITGLYHWDAESQMLGLFVLYVATIYNQAGGAIGKYFDEISSTVLKEHQAVEDAQITAVETTLKAYEKQKSLLSDVKELSEAQNALLTAYATALPKALNHKAYNDFKTKLINLESVERQVSDNFQRELIEAATKAVTAKFVSDEKLQSQSLTDALNFLETSKTPQSEPVGELFKAYLKEFREKVKKAEAKEYVPNAKLLAEVKEEVEKVCKRDGITFSEDMVPKKFNFSSI